MAGEQDELPDLAKLVIDIQKAVNAYGELQAQLAHAIKPQQEQWAAILAPLATAAIDWNTIQEQWRGQWTASQDAFAHLADAWAEAQAELAKNLVQAGPRLRRTLERADRIGQLGWTVTMTMTLADMATLSDMKARAEA